MRKKIFVRAVFAAALLAICAGSATTTAQTFDKRTFFTFNAPVAIPGVTLPAGKYLFRLAQTTDHHVVQVLSGDGRTSYAMFWAFRAERRDVISNPELQFMETPSDMTAAIDTWWYPAGKSGYEFVYPKEQARLLAKGAGRPVLTAAEPFRTDNPPAEYERVTPGGEYVPEPWPRESELGPSLEPRVRPTGPALTGAVAPPSFQVAERSQATLPETGSRLPLVAFGGLLLLLGGALSSTWLRARG